MRQPPSVEHRTAAAFDPKRFVGECLAAARSGDPVPAVRDVLAAAIAAPEAIDATLGTKVADDFGLLHASEELVVQRVVFPAGYSTGIHEHRLWTLAGVYAGREEHTIFRVVGERLEPDGISECGPGEIEILSPNQAHSSRAVGDDHVRGLHVYLGDLFASGAGEWDDVAGDRRPYTDAWFERLVQALEASGLR